MGGMGIPLAARQAVNDLTREGAERANPRILESLAARAMLALRLHYFAKKWRISPTETSRKQSRESKMDEGTPV